MTTHETESLKFSETGWLPNIRLPQGWLPNTATVVTADNAVTSGRRCGVKDFAVEDWEKIENCTFINSTDTIEMEHLPQSTHW